MAGCTWTLWQAPPANRAAMLLFVTGSQRTNLRVRGQVMGLALSRDGLKDRPTSELIPGMDDEADIFRALHMPYLPPECR